MKKKRPTEGECENTGQELKLNDTVELTWSRAARNEKKNGKLNNKVIWNFLKSKVLCNFEKIKNH